MGLTWVGWGWFVWLGKWRVGIGTFHGVHSAIGKHDRYLESHKELSLHGAFVVITQVTEKGIANAVTHFQLGFCLKCWNCMVNADPEKFVQPS